MKVSDNLIERIKACDTAKKDLEDLRKKAAKQNPPNREYQAAIDKAIQKLDKGVQVFEKSKSRDIVKLDAALRDAYKLLAADYYDTTKKNLQKLKQITNLKDHHAIDAAIRRLDEGMMEYQKSDGKKDQKLNGALEAAYGLIGKSNKETKRAVPQETPPVSVPSQAVSKLIENSKDMLSLLSLLSKKSMYGPAKNSQHERVRLAYASCVIGLNAAFKDHPNKEAASMLYGEIMSALAKFEKNFAEALQNNDTNKAQAAAKEMQKVLESVNKQIKEVNAAKASAGVKMPEKSEEKRSKPEEFRRF
jgi:hypothetical protein